MDILCLQETNLKRNEEKYLQHIFRNNIYHASSNTHTKGAMLGIGRQITWILEEALMDKECCYIILRGWLNVLYLTLIGAYAPNVGQASFWEQLLLKINVDMPYFIFLSDFNAVWDPKVHRSTVTKSLSIPLPLHNFFAFVDSRRSLHPEATDFTYFSARHNSYSRIAYIFVSRNIQSHIISANVEPCTISDHAPVNIRWQLDKHPFRRSNWRLDNFLLDNLACRSQIEAEIKSYFEINSGTADELIVWEAFKAYIRGSLISLKAHKTKLYNKATVEILREIVLLETFI